MTDQTTPPPGAGPDQPEEPSASAGGRSTTTAPPPGPSTPQARPLFRRTLDDKVVAGVSGGLARTFDLDAVVVRIVTVVLCVSFPPALIAYLGAWLLVARDDEEVGSTAGGIAFRRSGGVAFWLGVAVLVVAALAALDDPFRGGFNLVPLILVGIGVALWTRDGGRSRGDRSPAQQASWPAGHTGATPTTATSPTTSQPLHTTPTAGGDVSTATRTDAAGQTMAGAPADGTPPPAQPPTHQPPMQQPLPAGPPPPPRPTSPLGAITIALALIVTGVVAALDQVPGLPLDAHPSHLAAVALLVLGLGQLVGAFWGRARWLTLVAIFLIPPVLVGTVIREVDTSLEFGSSVDLGDGIGERVLRLDDQEALPEDAKLLVGTITVDLEDWAPDGAQLASIEQDDSDLHISVGAGEVVLIPPDDVPWRVVGEVGLGEASVRSGAGLIESSTTTNLGTPVEVIRTGGPQDGPVLDILVDLRVGELDLRVTELDTTTEELS